MGALRAATRDKSHSLGDCACLALCASRGTRALTTDRAWDEEGHRLGMAVELLR